MTTTYTPHIGSVAALVCRYFLKNASEELSAYDIGEKFGEATSQVSYRLARAIETGLLVRARSADGDVVYGPGPDIERLAAANATQSPETTTDTAMPAKQLPAKPVKAARRAAKDEDYATNYTPPPLVVVPPEPPALPVLPPVPEVVPEASQAQQPAAEPPPVDSAAAAKPHVLTTKVGAIRIDDGVPLPPVRAYCFTPERLAMQQLFDHLQPGQSAELALAMEPVISRVMVNAHKACSGKYTVRTFKDQQTLRVWRVA